MKYRQDYIFTKPQLEHNPDIVSTVEKYIKEDMSRKLIGDLTYDKEYKISFNKKVEDVEWGLKLRIDFNLEEIDEQEKENARSK